MTTAPLPDRIDLTYKVTKTDIAKGMKRDCQNCPQARALLRALKKQGFNRVSVGEFGIWAERPRGVVDDDGYQGIDIWSYGLKGYNPVRQFIKSFDMDKPVEPGEFSITLVRNPSR